MCTRPAEEADAEHHKKDLRKAKVRISYREKEPPMRMLISQSWFD